jgi:branched-chain amino acid transport system permease protein
MEIFVAQLISGIVVGSIYALMIIGFNLMHSVAFVTHFAYPHVVVLSMYAGWYALQATGDNIAIGILACIGAGIGISIATEPIFRPLTKYHAWIASFVVSLGLSMIFTDTMSHLLYHGRAVSFPANFTGTTPIFQLGIATLFRGQLMTFIGAITAMVVFFYVLHSTQTGRAFRAISENPFISRLRGIPIARTSLKSYAMAGLLGGISAVFLSMALRYASPALGDHLALKVLAIAMVAGTGNLRGGVIAGIIFGLIESMVMGYAPGNWSTAVVFGAILVSVMIKPTGLFAKST